MEDRYSVSRSGAYVENVGPWFDPWKEILAGMRVLSYHGMCDIHTLHSGGVEHTGREGYHEIGQYSEMRSDTRGQIGAKVARNPREIL